MIVLYCNDKELTQPEFNELMRQRMMKMIEVLKQERLLPERK
jgi:hypothetical protein